MDLSSILDLVLASFWKHFPIFVHTFSTLNFASIFECIFMENVPQSQVQTRSKPPETIIFGKFFQTSSFGCILVAFWLSFGWLWQYVGPFGTFLAPFCYLLATFWCPFAHPKALFSHFWASRRHFYFVMLQLFKCIEWTVSIHGMHTWDTCMEYHTWNTYMEYIHSIHT